MSREVFVHASLAGASVSESFTTSEAGISLPLSVLELEKGIEQISSFVHAFLAGACVRESVTTSEAGTILPLSVLSALQGNRLPRTALTAAGSQCNDCRKRNPFCNDAP